jgi:hypothetical protein
LVVKVLARAGEFSLQEGPRFRHLLAVLEPFTRGGCPECQARAAEAPDIEKRLLELLARTEPERKQTVREVVHEEPSVLAEHVDVTQVEEQLVARL